MELIFQERRREYLQRILNDTMSQEQTADVVIPDSFPDAQRVVDAFATLLIRSESCNADNGEIAGIVQAGVLFADEKGDVQQVSAQIPFSFRRDFPAQTEDCRLRCRCRLKSVDARLLNSRKVLVRVGICCTMEVFSRRTGTEYDIPEPAASLQLLRREFPLKMPMGLGERSFAVNEELELPGEKNAISRVLKTLFRPSVLEQRMVGDKAVFKGEILLHILYEDNEGNLNTCQWTVPFSQYAELERELDDCDVRTTLTMTAAEAEPDSQLESRRMLVSVNLLAQCLAVGEEKISLIADAFCTDATLEPAWDEWTAEGILDCQTFRETATAESGQNAERVLDAWVYPDEVLYQREGTQMRVELPLNCNTVFYDRDGTLQGKTLRATVPMTTELAEDAFCDVVNLSVGELFCGTNHGALCLRVPLDLTLESVAVQQMQAVCGATVTPQPHDGGKRPNVILRRVGGGETVWQIARALQTSVEGILQANHLAADSTPEDVLLLIPM